LKRRRWWAECSRRCQMGTQRRLWSRVLTSSTNSSRCSLIWRVARLHLLKLHAGPNTGKPLGSVSL
jgi:hypothetical protein